MKTKKFKCKVCGYIHEGTEAPAECPVCKAPASEFEEIRQGGVDTNSNSYTIIYAAVMVVVVALMLALTSGALKQKQTENIELDKKKQILSSINVDTKGQDASALYDKYITAAEIVDTKATVLSDDRDQAFAVDVVKESAKKDIAERQLPVYIATIDGDTKYILPVRGAGLWGALWGYVALNSDKSTIFGVYFSHASETPGLGAEITSNKFKEQFPGKHILNALGEFKSIAVMKAGQTAEGQDQVNALAGATITSKGLEAMLFTSIELYSAYLQPAATADAATTNEEEVEQ